MNSKRVASRFRTSQLAQTSHDLSNNFGVHAIAQVDWSLEAVRKRVNDQHALLQAATSALVRAVTKENQVYWLSPERTVSREDWLFVPAMNRSKNGTAEIRVKGRALSAQPDDVAKRHVA
jgi:hypothetical protein